MLSLDDYLFCNEEVSREVLGDRITLIFGEYAILEGVYIITEN
jgi:hypothetical protein